MSSTASTLQKILLGWKHREWKINLYKIWTTATMNGRECFRGPRVQRPWQDNIEEGLNKRQFDRIH